MPPILPSTPSAPGVKDVHVVGYPRSGNTWLMRLLSDILDCPLSQGGDAPDLYYGENRDRGKYKFRIHKHHSAEFEWDYRRDQGSVIFVCRDPRDVCTSIFHYRRLDDLDQALAIMLTYDDVFCVQPYQEFTRSWTNRSKYTGSPPYDTIIQYEQLHEMPILTLGRALSTIGVSLPNETVRRSFERQQFSRVLKLHPEYSHSMRNGIMGDWRNHFTSSFGQKFHELFGDLMHDQGYIYSDYWWETLPDTIP